MANDYTDSFAGEPYNIASGKPLSAAGVNAALNTREKVDNKKDTISNSATEYPSSKAVYDAMQAVNEIVDGVDILPKGTILAMFVSSWVNASAAFQSKWHVCDGSGGTPDLRGRFLRGGTASDQLTGGADSVNIQLQVKHLPSHSHSFRRVPDFWSEQAEVGPLYTAFTNPSTTNSPRIETATGSTGGNEAYRISTVPSYYTVIYIMKVA
jgi:hypothetical protein